MSKLEPRDIEWSTAEMHDGVLSVELTWPASKEWKRRFGGVLALLGRQQGEWGEIRLTRRGIEVAEVRPGSEADLRYFLESVVLQANSDLASRASKEGTDADAEDGQPQKQTENQMEATFRAFAEDAS
jgi:hypothetical protein